MFSARLAKINQWISLLTVIKKRTAFQRFFLVSGRGFEPLFRQ